VRYGAKQRRLHEVAAPESLRLERLALELVLFDGDGKLEIIIGADDFQRNGGRVHAFRADGSELPGFPIHTDQAMSSSPAIGDIDGDGKPEIVIGTGNFFTGRGHKVYAYHCDGSPVLGWPVNVDGQVVTAPALGDLVARGEVIRPGRTLTVTRAEVHDARGAHVASMQQTLMMLPDTPDIPE